MAQTNANRIWLKGVGQYCEKLADNGNVKPGHLVQRQSDDGVVPHATAQGKAERLFALEDANQSYSAIGSGRTISNAYSSGDRVPCASFAPGAEVLARLTSGQNVVEGQDLVSNGDGTLTTPSSQDSSILERDVVAKALAAVNNSGGTNPFIQVVIV